MINYVGVLIGFIIGIVVVNLVMRGFIPENMWCAMYYLGVFFTTGLAMDFYKKIRSR